MAIVVRLELCTHIDQLLLLETKYRRREKVQFTDGKTVQSVHRSGVVCPDFNASIQIRVGGAERTASSEGAEQARRFFEGIDFVSHKPIRTGVLNLKRNDR